MKLTRFILALSLAFPAFTSILADDFVDYFLKDLKGPWYLVSFQGGYTGGTITYHPKCGDSVNVSRVNGTDSIQICEYQHSILLSKETYRVCWSAAFNNWELCHNESVMLIEITPYSFTTYQTEMVRKYMRTVDGLNPCDPTIETAADALQGRWYLTSMGSGPYQIRMTPVAGDSILLNRIAGTDSIHGEYFHQCILNYTDTYRIIIDSSYSLQTDALMLVNQSAMNRMLVTVFDRKIILKTDSIPGHYMVFEPVDTFTLKRAPLITGVIGDTVCGSGEIALMASSDPGEIRWYTDRESDTVIANGEVFFPPELSETTTYYVEAAYNNCVTPERTAVTAVVNAVPEITAVTDGTRCGEGQVLLVAQASAGNVVWYADSTAEEALAEGPVFNTPVLNNTTVYFAGAVNEGCISSERLPVTAIVSYNDTCSATSIKFAEDADVIAFPDPTSGKFEINLKQIRNYPQMVRIFNSSGILMAQNYLEESRPILQLDISEFPGGLYFIVLQGCSEVHALKILKQ